MIENKVTYQLSIIVNNRIESERFYLILAAFIFICIFVFYKKINELQQPIITTGDSSEQEFWSYRYKNKLQFFTKVCCCFLILSYLSSKISLMNFHLLVILIF